METVEKAKAFATELHAGQEYGDGPYTVHLEAVANEARLHNLSDDIVAAAWLHDTLEDTNTTYEELVTLFGRKIALLVEGVTDEPGKNRRERALKTLPKTRTLGSDAVALKLCDRLANVKACVDGIGNVNLLKMYKQEYPVFRSALHEFGELPFIWQELDRLIKWNTYTDKRATELADDLEKLALSESFHETVRRKHLEDAVRCLRWTDTNAQGYYNGMARLEEETERLERAIHLEPGITQHAVEGIMEAIRRFRNLEAENKRLRAVVDKMREVDRIHAEDEVDKRDAGQTD